MQIYFKYILSLISSENKKSKSLPAQAGFTLTELIVVIAIATVIMTSLVIQQSKWSDNIAVSTQAYEMALMIRQAQIYALGVRESATGSGNFDIGYGVYFSSENTDALKRYIFFRDTNKDGQYNVGEEIETKTFTRGVTINRFCGLNPGGQEKCSDAGNMDSIHISFFRPEPKANILILNHGVNQSGSVEAPAIIYLKASGSRESSVRIEANGQISIGQ